MNEPKKRGRPSKAELEARANAQVEGGDVTIPPPPGKAASFERAMAAHLYANAPMEAKAAQAYASKVWANQSPSLERGARLHRVKLALEAQGLSMDGVVL